MRYSKFLVAAIVILNATFTAAALWVYLRIGSEPTALIGAWFSFTTIELWQIAMIKKRKLSKAKGDEHHGI